MKKASSPPKQDSGGGRQPSGAGGRAALESLVHQITRKVLEDPRKAAVVLTEWLKQPAGRKSPPASKKKAA